VNDARISRGLPPLGFLNPLLYSSKISATFNDITIGNNPGCGTPGFNVRILISCVYVDLFARNTDNDSIGLGRMGSDHWAWHAQLWEAQGSAGALGGALTKIFSPNNVN
jgi:hypothetical protein